MNIYVLKRSGRVSYDECEGFVIVAESPEDARILANRRAGDEGKIWDDPAKASCEIVDPSVEGIVLEAFRAG